MGKLRSGRTQKDQINLRFSINLWIFKSELEIVLERTLHHGWRSAIFGSSLKICSLSLKALKASDWGDTVLAGQNIVEEKIFQAAANRQNVLNWSRARNFTSHNHNRTPILKTTTRMCFRFLQVLLLQLFLATPVQRKRRLVPAL